MLERCLVETLSVLLAQQCAYMAACTPQGYACRATLGLPLRGQVFTVLSREGINVVMMSQGASKTNISLVVDSRQATVAITALHAEFFETV